MSREKPFRWDVSRREQLGGLVDLPKAEHYAKFTDDLQRCCARVISFCGDSDLVFVGRSPESIFDFLSGLLADTSWKERSTLLNFSMRYDSVAKIQRNKPTAVAAIHEQFRSLGMAPASLIARRRNVALVDLVATGATLGHLVDLLLQWASDEKVDVPSVRRRLRVVGITWRTKTSPKTWRWQQHVEWARQFKPSTIKNVSIPGRLWDYLGNTQKKVTPSNPPWRWSKADPRRPPRSEAHLQALSLAHHLHEAGRTKPQRLAFAAKLSKETGMKYSWFRTLVNELKRA
jgi:hypothetical protein